MNNNKTPQEIILTLKEKCDKQKKLLESVQEIIRKEGIVIRRTAYSEDEYRVIQQAVSYLEEEILIRCIESINNSIYMYENALQSRCYELVMRELNKDSRKAVE